VQQTEQALLDHLIGALLEKKRYVEAKSLGSLEIDHEVELEGNLDGKLARLRTPQDAIGIGRRAPIIIELVISIGQQAPKFTADR
jgi:hypothetical protein